MMDLCRSYLPLLPRYHLMPERILLELNTNPCILRNGNHQKPTPCGRFQCSTQTHIGGQGREIYAGQTNFLSSFFDTFPQLLGSLHFYDTLLSPVLESHCSKYRIKDHKFSCLHVKSNASFSQNIDNSKALTVSIQFILHQRYYTNTYDCFHDWFP